MTAEIWSQDGEQLDRWLAACHKDLGASLTAELDIQAGLSDIDIALEHLEMGDEIRELLYTQAGLHAMLPNTPKAARGRNSNRASDRHADRVRDKD